MIGRDADCDVRVCALARGFMCIECSLAKHAGSSLLCTRANEMCEHLARHEARGQQVPQEAIEALGRG